MNYVRTSVLRTQSQCSSKIVNFENEINLKEKGQNKINKLQIIYLKKTFLNFKWTNNRKNSFILRIFYFFTNLFKKSLKLNKKNNLLFVCFFLVNLLILYCKI